MNINQRTRAAQKRSYMLICDMHCDSLLTVSSEVGLLNEYNHSKKGTHLQLFAHFIPKANESPESRRRRLMSYCNVYLSEVARLGIEPLYDCRSVMEMGRGVHSMLSIEGGGGLFADSSELTLLWRAGLRVLGLAWDTNELSASAWDDNDTGLTERGAALARVATEMGIILDVSHASDKAFYQMHEIIPYPMLATHSNFRSVANSPRNLTDDMAKELVSRGGVIGLNLYPGFLNTERDADTNDVLRHVDYALTRFGDECLGFGCDIDGTDGRYPKGIRSDASIHEQLCDLFLSKYSASTVEKIAGENIKRFFAENLT